MREKRGVIRLGDFRKTIGTRRRGRPGLILIQSAETCGPGDKKGVRYLLRGTRPSGASHKRYRTLIYPLIYCSLLDAQGLGVFTIDPLERSIEGRQIFKATLKSDGGDLAVGLRKQGFRMTYSQHVDIVKPSRAGSCLEAIRESPTRHAGCNRGVA